MTTAFDGIPGLSAGVADIGGHDVRFYDTGHFAGRSGPTVVLIHSALGDSETDFWALLSMLSFRKRVISVDYIDCGDVFDLGSSVETIHGVISRIAPDEELALIGYSFGAAVAVSLAAAHPERVSSLVTVSGWLAMDQEQRFTQRLWRKLAALDLAALAELQVSISYDAPYLNKRPVADFADLLSNTEARLRSRRGLIARSELMESVAIAETAYSIEKPALVIGCLLDKVAPIHHSRLLFGALENSRYAELPTGHAILDERASEVFWLANQFINSPQLVPAGSVIESRPLGILTPAGTVDVRMPPPQPGLRSVRASQLQEV